MVMYVDLYTGVYKTLAVESVSIHGCDDLSVWCGSDLCTLNRQVIYCQPKYYIYHRSTLPSLAVGEHVARRISGAVTVEQRH